MCLMHEPICEKSLFLHDCGCCEGETSAQRSPDDVHHLHRSSVTHGAQLCRSGFF